MEKVVLASNNKNKIKEILQIYKDKEILSLNEIGFLDDIEETGETFLENALIKAKTVSEYLKKKGLFMPVIADDSGLCVNTLDGKPGVYSARYAGEHGNNEENRKKLLENMETKDDRSAYFVCTMVEYFPNDKYIFSEGKTYGQITKQEIGDKSFCYDCIFFSDDLQKTFGQATSEEKNSVSHRKRAIQLLIEKENKLTKK